MSRLGYDDLLTIYKYISLDLSASQIAKKMKISTSTLYRLIANNIEVKKRESYSLSFHFRDCKSVSECKKTIKRCPDVCDRFEKYLCDKLCHFPFICDFCESKTYCGKERHLWNPVLVYQGRIERLKKTRSHLSLSKAKIEAFNDWLRPYIKRKCSIEVIHSQYPHAFPVSTATVRRWIDKGVMTIRRIDLLHAVTFKTKKQYALRRPSSMNPLLKYGHTYPYFLDYINTHPVASIIEMDTVHGLMSEEIKLLTIYHRQSHLQLGILIPNSRPISVTRVLQKLQQDLGKWFTPLFEVILADNGFEFDELIPASINSETGEVYSNVFYTRPYNSGDKGGCERNHELFRYLVPKGHGLSDLTQKDIDFMFSMINSYPRESLNWKTPIDVFKKYFPSDILNLFSLKSVPLESLNLKR